MAELPDLVSETIWEDSEGFGCLVKVLSYSEEAPGRPFDFFPTGKDEEAKLALPRPRIN